ncbi:fimbria/pilus outer membrane usher protein [Sphingobium sp. EM0848]|uniref:fimbria/pilus outer membrane usher protein n=1 Tax=Sphingobium sp. EM0848 TaxID=2743473 RepID=UPI00159C0F83|nr:fimbria/pilus outer membrane usher protein [Sphingobium sp. EM0848]
MATRHRCYPLSRTATAIAIAMMLNRPAYGAPKPEDGRDLVPAQSATASPAEGGPQPQRINPTKRTLWFVVPLADGPAYLGDVELAVSPGDELSVATPRFLQLLQPLVRDEVYQHITAAAGDAKTVGAPVLGREGIVLVYDSARLALTILIPVVARRTKDISLRNGMGQIQTNLAPAHVSAYLNLRSSADIVYQGPDAGIQAPVTDMDGAVRIADVVAEGEAYVSARPGDVPFRRVGSRLVYDDMQREMRWVAGDVRPLARSFQGSPVIGGLAVGRLYSELEPQREIRSSGQQSFSILGPSTVEVIVNGRSIERRRMQPGTYALSDFPLADGANDVRLVIEDETGNRRTIDFSQFSDRALLQPGLSEFSLSGGALALPSRAGLSYSRRAIGSAFWRRGLTQQLTAGINAQADGRAQQFGVELLFGSAWGLVGIDLTGSRSDDGRSGMAVAVTYQLLRQSLNSLQSQSLRAAFEYRSVHFAIPGDFQLLPSGSLRASLTYNRNLGLDRYVGFDLRYSRLAGQPSEFGVRTLSGVRLGETMRLTAEAEYRRLDRRNDGILRVGIIRRLGSRAQLRAEATSKGVMQGSYQAYGGQGLGAWSLSADVNRTPQGTTFNAGGTYTGNRAEWGVSHIAAFADGSGQGLDQRTSLRMGTSIAFADGAVAVGRPITNSFLIAVPHHSLRSKSVRLEPQAQGETAHSGALGPALASNLSAYSNRTMTYDVPDAPAGYDLGQGNAQVRPPYRSGYKLPIGSDYHLLVFGRLIDANGEPISLLAGKATDLGNPKREAMTIFTGRNGKFGAQGMRPGRWRIEMPTQPPTVFEIIVGQADNDVVQLGDVHAAGGTQGGK